MKPVVEKALVVVTNTVKAVGTKEGLKSKTVLFGAALVLLSGVQWMLPELEAFLGQYATLANAGIGLAIVVLRTMTTQPLESNKEE